MHMCKSGRVDVVQVSCRGRVRGCVRGSAAVVVVLRLCKRLCRRRIEHTDLMDVIPT